MEKYQTELFCTGGRLLYGIFSGLLCYSWYERGRFTAVMGALASHYHCPWENDISRKTQEKHPKDFIPILAKNSESE